MQSNIRYQKWLSVRIDHNYFPGGVCDVLSFEPLAQTVRVFKNYSLKSSLFNNVLSLYCGYDPLTGSLDLPKQLAGIDDLYFQILCSDNNFLNYTDLPLVSNTAQLLFLSNAGQPGTGSLQQNQFISQADQVIYSKPWFSVAMPAQESNTLVIKTKTGEDIITSTVNGLQSKNFNIDLTAYGTGYYSLWINNDLITNYFVSNVQLAENCIGILHIAVSQLLTGQVQQPLLLTGAFNCRSTFWKYSVIITPDKPITVIRMSIENASGIEYDAPVSETIVGGALATVYTSSKPVPLKKVSVSNQTLKISYSNIFSDRNGELSLRLPDPDVSSLQINQSNVSLISSKLIYV